MSENTAFEWLAQYPKCAGIATTGPGLGGQRSGVNVHLKIGDSEMRFHTESEGDADRLVRGLNLTTAACIKPINESGEFETFRAFSEEEIARWAKNIRRISDAKRERLHIKDVAKWFDVPMCTIRPNLCWSCLKGMDEVGPRIADLERTVSELRAQNAELLEATKVEIVDINERFPNGTFKTGAEGRLLKAEEGGV